MLMGRVGSDDRMKIPPPEATASTEAEPISRSAPWRVMAAAVAFDELTVAPWSIVTLPVPLPL